MSGSRSKISDSLNHVCQLYDIKKDRLWRYNLSEIMYKIHRCYSLSVSEDDMITSSVINDMLNLRQIMGLNDIEFTAYEIDTILNQLCIG